VEREKEGHREREIMLHKLLAQGLPISTFWPVKSCVSEVGTAVHRWSKEQSRSTHKHTHNPPLMWASTNVHHIQIIG
jgi:hypothetical protein